MARNSFWLPFVATGATNAIENSVSSYFWYTFIHSFNIFDRRLSCVNLIGCTFAGEFTY